MELGVEGDIADSQIETFLRMAHQGLPGLLLTLLAAESEAVLSALPLLVPDPAAVTATGWLGATVSIVSAQAADAVPDWPSASTTLTT